MAAVGQSFPACRGPAACSSCCSRRTSSKASPRERSKQLTRPPAHARRSARKPRTRSSTMSSRKRPPALTFADGGSQHRSRAGEGRHAAAWWMSTAPSPQPAGDPRRMARVDAAQRGRLCSSADAILARKEGSPGWRRSTSQSAEKNRDGDVRRVVVGDAAYNGSAPPTARRGGDQPDSGAGDRFHLLETAGVTAISCVELAHG